MKTRTSLSRAFWLPVLFLYLYFWETWARPKGPARGAPGAFPRKKAPPAPARVPAPATPSPQILPTPAPSARVPTPATEGREQEATVETDLVKVVLSNRGGVIKRWELKQIGRAHV